MKHAGQDALDRLEPLLKQIRRREALKEKSRGAFYRGGHGFLHFHEHGPALFADIGAGNDFERLPATSRAECKALLARVDALLADGSPTRAR